MSYKRTMIISKQFIIIFSLFLASTDVSLAQPLSLNLREVIPAVSSANDTIYYEPGDKLEWNNFKTITQPTGNVAALTASGFGFNAGMLYKNGRGSITISTYCFFSRSASWVKPGRKTDYILAHEQHHFDISYIGMKIFMERLEQTSFTMQNYSALLNKIYNESYKYMSDLQNQYDAETKNGQLPDRQAAWINSIDKTLNGITANNSSR
ncbi:MAG: hypothetical protein ABJA78_18850 [Ferruginibacter sp.]